MGLVYIGQPGIGKQTPAGIGHYAHQPNRDIPTKLNQASNVTLSFVFLASQDALEVIVWLVSSVLRVVFFYFELSSSKKSEYRVE